MTNIETAIRERREVEFVYDGLPRVVQPAAHGIHKSTGNEFMRGYQVGGTSSSRATPLWDMFLVAKIGGFVVTDRTFAEDPPFYSRGDKHMSRIFSQL